MNKFRSSRKTFKFDGSFVNWTPHIPNHEVTILKCKLLSLINNAISQSTDQHSVPNISYKPLTCSVPWAQFCPSDIYWSSGNIINSLRYWIVEYFRRYFTLLKFFYVFYFDMDNEVSKVKGLSNSRFGPIIFLLRLTGIPFKMKKMSTLYAIYMTTVISCFCATYVGMFFDVYIHRNDFGHVMTNIRVSIVFANFLWMFIYCR